jgi:hypothetical protein
MKGGDHSEKGRGTLRIKMNFILEDPLPFL